MADMVRYLSASVVIAVAGLTACGGITSRREQPSDLDI